MIARHETQGPKDDIWSKLAAPPPAPAPTTPTTSNEGTTDA